MTMGRSVSSSSPLWQSSVGGGVDVASSGVVSGSPSSHSIGQSDGLEKGL